MPGEETVLGLMRGGVAERTGLALRAARMDAASDLSFDVVIGMGMRSSMEEMLCDWD